MGVTQKIFFGSVITTMASAWIHLDNFVHVNPFSISPILSVGGLLKTPRMKVQSKALAMTAVISESSEHIPDGISATTTTAAAAPSSMDVTTAKYKENKEKSSDIDDDEHNRQENRLYKLQGRLLKEMRRVCLEYNMLEDGDHIMVCVSGGKDSAALLFLLRLLQQWLRKSGNINFDITAVHVDQKQPGYNGTTLAQWLEHDLQVNYLIKEEDTYSIVVDKTEPNKSYCSLCSRLRRGILYSTALDELQCNKIALGHHADDCLETLLLNMIHTGQMKAMPARYTAQRGKLAVLRPLITCFESDIADYAALSKFPILPCNLCSNQANLQRPQVKMLLNTLEGLNRNAKLNLLRSCQSVRPSHLLDRTLREACGMNPITGEEEDDEEMNEPI